MNTEWFPRPDRAEDIELVAPCGRWTQTSLLSLLQGPDAVEWRHKVGVTGPVGGSARPTTRLLAARGWVFKTRTDETWETRDEARARVIDTRAAGLLAGLWHHEKVWALARCAGAWRRYTVCPELVTLRQLKTFEERTRAWVEMIQRSIDVYCSTGLGLDLNPSNFGRTEAPSNGLYYLDDEHYLTFSERDLAGALVARIPEESAADSERWRALGAGLFQRLDLRAFTWESLRQEVRAYPLPERFESSREALLEGAAPPSRTRVARATRSEPGDLTCVLADVHANRPALRAVIDDATARGARSFLFLGDAVGYGPHPRECIEILASLPSAITLRGNHDNAVGTGQIELGMHSLARHCAEWTRSLLSSEELGWLASLPIEHREDEWMAVHGAPQDARRFLAYVYDLTFEDNLRCLKMLRIPLCFHGHTHVQITHTEPAAGPMKLLGLQTFKLVARQRYLVNPGSVGQPRDSDARAAYALWDRQRGEITTLRVAYDIDQTVRDLRAAALPPQLEQRLLVGR